MPNEFGVCMVYGRCCTEYDGARQAWISRHFCICGADLKSWVLSVVHILILSGQIGWKETRGSLRVRNTLSCRAMDWQERACFQNCLINLFLLLYIEKTAFMWTWKIKKFPFSSFYGILEEDASCQLPAVSVKFSSVIHLTVDNYYLHSFGFISISV